MNKRNVEIVVISDVHLGTYGCHAKELVNYLKSVHPKKLILNGDIVDAWAFNKNYFPQEHMEVIGQIINMTTKGVEVYYLTGNHDDILRKFSDFKLANFYLSDKIVLKLDKKKAWFFHGDIFDFSMKHTTKLAKIGGIAYDYLILGNRLINRFLKKIGKEPYSFAHRIKKSVKTAIKYIEDFEMTAAKLAIANKYDYVVCGHIHQPEKRRIETEDGTVMYLNSGDWVENLSALEYYDNDWHIFYYDHMKNVDTLSVIKIKEMVV